MKITNCRTNHLENPVGYAMSVLTFSWQVEDAEGKRQEAARIRIRKEELGTNAAERDLIKEQLVADTGWKDLDSLASSVPVKLEPRTRYAWTVEVRTDAGEQGKSETQFFETSKREEPWSAKWIGCDRNDPRHPIFSKEIRPSGEVCRASLYICGLGLYEASWNGEKIGGELLAPYCNDYNEWVQYQTYDVTDRIREKGVLSVLLGNGWYSGRFTFDPEMGPYYGDDWKLLAELHLVYEDGTEEVVGTDETWMVTRSNIIFSNIYDGEQRDDTLEPVMPVPAVPSRAPKGKLTARYSTPVMVRKEMPVQELIHTPKGEMVLDLGQNLTGGFRLRVHAVRGQKIRIQFGEILQNGNFYRDNLRTAKAEYLYTSDGNPHVLEPKFTYYGYRYVRIEGIPDLKAEDFMGLSEYSDLPRTGVLETGNPLVNRLIANAEWGQVDNFLDVPTDCPQRDERMGWTGDAQVFCPTACYQRDSYAFYAKYLHDVASEQKEWGGKVPVVIPSFGKTRTSSAWSDAACIIPWALYQFYGDPAILQTQYGSMKSWVNYITSVDGTDHGWRREFHFGDWLALDVEDENDCFGGTDIGFIASCEYLNSAEILAKTADLLGKNADAGKYRELTGHILQGIRKDYFTESGHCRIQTQTALLMAVRYHLGPDPDVTVKELGERFQADEGKLKTGFVGTPLLCPVLSECGYDDTAFHLLLNEGYPGWLYAVKLGATTIWERWNSVGSDGKIAENGMNSLNHYAYGSIVEWLYRDVAGIRPVLPGFRRCRLEPHVSRELGSAKAEYRSAAGVWKSAWSVDEDGSIHYACRVPFNCTAEVVLPFGGGSYEIAAGSFETTYMPVY